MTDLCDRLMENAFGPAQCPVCGVERGSTMGCGEPCSFATDYGESRSSFADPWRAKRDIAALVAEVRWLRAANAVLRDRESGAIRERNNAEARVAVQLTRINELEARLAEAVEPQRIELPEVE